MQLIMDTETHIDIKNKMSSIEEPLDKNLKDPSEVHKNQIVNGNKENIEIQQNVLESAVNAVNGDDQNCDDESSSPPAPTDNTKSVAAPSEREGEDIKTDNDLKENKCETNNGNGIIEASEDKEIINGNSSETKTLENKHNNISHNENTIGENSKSVEVIKIDNCLTNAIEKEIENTSLSNEDGVKLDAECFKSDKKATVYENTEGQNDLSEKDVSKTELTSENEIENITVNNKIAEEKCGTETSETQVSVKPDAEHKANKITDSDSNAISEEILGEEISTKETEQKNNEDVINHTDDLADTEPKEIMDVVEDENDLVILNSENSITNVPKTKDIKASEAEETEENDSILEDEQISNIDEANNKTDTALIVEDDLKENNLIQDIQDSDKDNEEPVIVVPHETIQEISTNSSKSIEDVTENDLSLIETNKEDILDVDDFMKDIDENISEHTKNTEVNETILPAKTIEPTESKKTPICKLSNTLDILSDDDEDAPQQAKDDNSVANLKTTDKQCINIEDDDDIMLIDEDTNIQKANSKDEMTKPVETKDMDMEVIENEIIEESTIDVEKSNEIKPSDDPQDSLVPESAKESIPEEKEKTEDEKQPKIEQPTKPLLGHDFLKGFKKNLTDMTRDELEEFCIIKIVEGIMEKSNFNDIQSKLKAMAKNVEEYKKKAMMLSKQNRDLQLVLKSVQEELKNKTDTHIVPLKITRSVGMQVIMSDKSNQRKRSVGNPGTNANNMNVNNKISNNNNNRQPNQSPRPQKPVTTNIPVPRLVPASTVAKPPVAPTQPSPSNTKTNNQTNMNGVKAVASPQKTAEKRTRVQSVTVDLTDDEPPSKVTPRSSPAPPVRLVSPQNLMARPQFAQSLNSPRKVYIPISGPQSQNIRPGQTIMLKSVPPPGQRIRGPAQIQRPAQNQSRPSRVQGLRHPAPLPECMKQYQPPNWKSLPPAPDLKLSKVDNGIVISWKIEGYQEDSYEEIASYQLYAYQETSVPPSTTLWKKIGDVKALPLPMACTLTQFMAGFKYYFAVRAVDVRSRLGPFSLPGSILLLNKM